MAEASRFKDATKRIRKQIDLRSIFLTCKHYHHHHAAAAGGGGRGEGTRRKCKKIGCSGSICKLRDMQQRSEPAASPVQPCKRKSSTSVVHSCSPSPRSNNAGVASNSVPSSHHSGLSAPSTVPSSPSPGGSLRGMQLRRISGCYECHNAVDPAAGASVDSPSPGGSISSCSQCGETVKAESLERHQTVMHAVSELDPEDSSRNIVEIIFLSSWLKKQAPVCHIDRILKVQNNQKTIAMFEEYRDSVKSKANKLAKKHPRCTADGNELLRFYCTTSACSLGLNGATSLCSSIPDCNLCSIIRDGFKPDGHGRIRTMATSGLAHDLARSDPADERNAMLVCRVIAGRVRRNQDSLELYDSVAGTAGTSNLDELFVFNSRAILPCFVVIYKG